MAASAILGYATVALDTNRLNQLGVIGPIIAGVFALLGRILDNAAASRRQKRELRYRNGQSVLNGFLLATVLVSIVVAVYFYNHPRHEVRASDAPVPSVVPTTATPASTITLEEASAFVASFLDKATHKETEDQAWAMYTDAHANDLTAKHGGIAGFKSFWESVDTVESPDESSKLTEATPTRAVLVVPLNFKLLPNSKGVRKCTIEHDTYILVRTNGTLQIDNYVPDATDCP